MHRGKRENITAAVRSPAGRRLGAGLSLVEVLIAVAITAMLLLAVAVAFQASFVAYEENQDLAYTTQAGRIALHQILSKIRRGNCIQTSGGDTISFFTHEGQDTTYTYDADNRRLLYIIDYGEPSQQSYVMLEGVDGFSVEPADADISSEKAILTITLSVRSDLSGLSTMEQSGRNSVALTASVLPREAFGS